MVKDVFWNTSAGFARYPFWVIKICCRQADCRQRFYHNQETAGGFRAFTFHALRHTFATRALEQRIDAKTLSLLLGHYSVAFTFAGYIPEFS